MQKDRLLSYREYCWKHRCYRARRSIQQTDQGYFCKRAHSRTKEEATSITTEERSFVNVILRKILGDARVALYILEHSIPTLLEQPLLKHPLQKATMETMLEEIRIWHVSLLQWLDEQQLQAHLAELRDTNRKCFHNMSATEQSVLEDHDSGKLQKHHDDVRMRKPK